MIIEKPVPTASEFDVRFKRDHAGRVVAAQANSKQPCGRRGGVSECPKSRLRRRFPWNPSQCHAGESEIRMIKHIEKLRFHAQLSVLRQGEILGEVKVIPHRSEERRVGKECRSRWSP